MRRSAVALSVACLVLLVGSVTAGGRPTEPGPRLATVMSTHPTRSPHGSLQAALADGLKRLHLAQPLTIPKAPFKVLRVPRGLGRRPSKSSACFVGTSVCKSRACTAEFIGSDSQTAVVAPEGMLPAAASSQPRVTSCPRPQPPISGETVVKTPRRHLKVLPLPIPRLNQLSLVSPAGLR
jgi:hypothetical protein